MRRVARREKKSSLAVVKLTRGALVYSTVYFIQRPPRLRCDALNRVTSFT